MYEPKVKIKWKGIRVQENTTPCRSNNIIYCITCQRRMKQYVGQTGNTLHKRFGVHSGAIGRGNLVQDVSGHCIHSEHGRLSDMKIHIVDFIHVHPKSDHGIILLVALEWQSSHVDYLNGKIIGQLRMLS